MTRHQGGGNHAGKSPRVILHVDLDCFYAAVRDSSGVYSFLPARCPMMRLKCGECVVWHVKTKVFTMQARVQG